MRFALATSIVALTVLTAAAPSTVGRRSSLAIPITKRSGLVNSDGSVNIAALKAHVAATVAKIERGLDNFEENTGTPHPSASKNTKRRDTSGVSLTDYESSLWYGTVSVGTPASDFTVDFDTGSSDLFLPGPDCTDSNCQGHTIYNPDDSSTSKDLGQTFSLGFGYSSTTGSTVSGEEYSDTVTVAGLTATKQTLGVASTYSDSFSETQFPADGVLGMAFESLSGFGASPVFQTIISQDASVQPVFSFKLAATGSELYLGGANEDLYTGNFTFTPVTQQAYWQVNMNSVESGGTTILSNVDSVIDTGTTLVVGTTSDVTSLYETLGGTDASSTVGQGYYTFPCDSFPSVSFNFGGTSFTIPPGVLNLGQATSGSSQCVSGIVAGSDFSFWVIGDVFLSNVYTQFDVGNAQVGFAQLPVQIEGVH